MSAKVIGWIAAGVTLAAAVGGLIWYLKRREAKGSGGRVTPGPAPSGPPRAPASDEPKQAPKHPPTFHFMGRDVAHLEPELVAILDEAYDSGWPPEESSLDQLETDDVIVFAVESEPVGPYEKSVQELISAQVLSVEKTVIRARVVTPVRHSEHLGTTAGHGLRVGTAVEVPRSSVLVGGRRKKAEGYDSRGKAATTFKPSSDTKQTYLVNPGTPYDLRLPYTTPDLEWYVDNTKVKLVHIGDDGLFHQILFAEDSLRGPVSVRVLDNDPKLGNVLVGRWDFKLGD